MRAVSLRNIALAGVAGAAVVLIYFAPWWLAPFLFKPSKQPVPNTLIFGVAAAGAVLAAALAAALPKHRIAIIRILAATAFVYLSWRLAIFWINWLFTFDMTSEQAYWVCKGPGNGVIGLLPSSILILLGGRFLFGLSLREQWNGRLMFAWRDWVYGGSVAIGMSAFVLGGALLSGLGRVAWEPNWSSHGVNVFSNLYEEILVRSMLLQVARRYAGNWPAMLWTGLIFGSMHGLSWLALGFAVCTWVIAWVVLRAGSLWAGWVFHQAIDMIVDSLLH